MYELLLSEISANNTAIFAEFSKVLVEGQPISHFLQCNVSYSYQQKCEIPTKYPLIQLDAHQMLEQHII